MGHSLPSASSARQRVLRGGGEAYGPDVLGGTGGEGMAIYPKPGIQWRTKDQEFPIDDKATAWASGSG